MKYGKERKDEQGKERYTERKHEVITAENGRNM